MTPQLTHEEIERMRLIVNQHDQQHSKGIKEFDLNNPPKEPYRYQEFPRLVYMHGSDKTRIVANDKQLEAALAEGWSKEAVPVEYKEPKLSRADQAEAKAVDKQLRAPKKEK